MHSLQAAWPDAWAETTVKPEAWHLLLERETENKLWHGDVTAGPFCKPQKGGGSLLRETYWLLPPLKALKVTSFLHSWG